MFERVDIKKICDNNLPIVKKEKVIPLAIILNNLIFSQCRCQIHCTANANKTQKNPMREKTLLQMYLHGCFSFLRIRTIIVINN